MTAVALCFPGQGSQAAGMAEGLLEHPAAAALVEEAASAGVDLRAVLGGGEEELRSTDMAQPALVFTEVVLAAALPDDLHVVGVAGHSVGELAALVAARALEPRDGMRLAIERGRLMAGMREGGMVALLGIDDELAGEICDEVVAAGEGTVVVANLNSPGQVVVSGDAAGLEGAARRARERGARRVTPLRVGGAFHSPLMTAAADRFAADVKRTRFADPVVSVVCNVDAQAVDDAEGLRSRLVRQLVSPVRWTESVRRIASLGAGILVEVGPGSVLTGLHRRILPGHRALAVCSLAAASGLGEEGGLRDHVPAELPAGG